MAPSVAELPNSPNSIRLPQTNGVKLVTAKDGFVDLLSETTNTLNDSKSQVPRVVDIVTTSISSLEQIDSNLKELFAENVAGKIWRVAVNELKKENALTTYPHTVPVDGPTPGQYDCREAAFWTCGFFPGSMYALLERSIKYPQAVQFPPSVTPSTFRSLLLSLCREWTVPIRAMASRTDTHDMAFIIEPSLRMDYELTGEAKSFQSIITAAESLATRWDEKVGAIRSWDVAINKRYSFTDLSTDFLVIIDSMCNLDLLYYAGHHTRNQHLIDIATTHAHTVLRSLVRPNHSTYHLVNFSPSTGAVKNQLTNQGYKDWSTWSRGQSWGILGYAQTYMWTKDSVFLDAACDLADYFIGRLKESESGRKIEKPFVPLWDFDAPVGEDEVALRDTSAGMIAANGMLILHQQRRTGPDRVSYLDYAIRIVKETVELALSSDVAKFQSGLEDGQVKVNEGTFDAILMHATANNNEDAHMPYKDHGLVYADYYFLEFGNKLLRMGMV